MTTPETKAFDDQADGPFTPPSDDPASAFARAPTGNIPPADKSKESKGSKNKNKDREVRAPKVERIAPPPPAEDDEGMDPLDAAEEIINLMDKAFAAAAAFRGYADLQVEGVSLLEAMAPDEKAKARTKKAVARLLRTAGASMSPGMGLAVTAFGCYGAPIIGLEIARKKLQPKAG